MPRCQQTQFEHKDSRELIAILKNIITSQELKIAELQKDLKRWQKKYKEEFFKDTSYKNQQHEKSDQSQQLILNFSKELFLLQSKYDKKAANSYRLTPNHSLREALDLIEELYTDLGSKLQQINQKSIIIDHQSHQIEQYKQKMQAYLQQFAITVKKSQEYEQKLFAQIQKLQREKIGVKQ